MNEFITIYEISAETHGQNGDLLELLAIGVILLTTGVIGIFFPERTKVLFDKKLDRALIVTALGGIWLLVIFLSWKMYKSDMNLLLNEYQSGHSQIAEGVVHVTHEQPFVGHSAGDKITVGGQKFEIGSPNGDTTGYHRTICHGGALREGVYARVHYHKGNYLNGAILKVEIQDENQQNFSTVFQ